MGICFSSSKPRIKIIDEAPPGEKLYYLKPEGTITYTIGRTYNIPMIEIQFDGWFESSVRLWPKDNRARSTFLLLERAPPPSSSISSLSDSGVDTVF